MNSITVTAIKWEGGWELWHGDDCWTQVATLDRATDQIRDYLDTVEPGTDHSAWHIVVVPELPDGLGDEVERARQDTAEAARATQRAASRARHVVTQLRELGYSVTDTAAIMGVSRGRVSQLTAHRQ